MRVTTPKILSAAIAAAGMLAFASMAQAAATTDWTTLISSAGGVPNQLTDVNGENLIKGLGVTGAQNTDVNTIQTGDWLYGVLDFNRISNGSHSSPGVAIGSGTVYSEFTGIFLLKVASITPSNAVPGQFDIQFTSDAAKFNSQFGLVGPNQVASGTMVRTFDDFAQDFSTSGTLASSITSASNGSRYWDAGFTGASGASGAGEFWTVIGGSTNWGGLSSLGTSFTLGTANFAIDPTASSVGPAVLKQSGIAVVNGVPLIGNAAFLGSSTIKGIQAGTTVWQANSQTNFSFVVPLPAAVWAGLSMLGAMGGVRFLRRKLSA